jgi:hypothetical protein
MLESCIWLSRLAREDTFLAACNLTDSSPPELRIGYELELTSLTRKYRT